MQTVLHGKIKEKRGERLIGMNTQNVYLSIITTKHKTTHRHVRRLWRRAKVGKRVLVIGKVLSCAGA